VKEEHTEKAQDLPWDRPKVVVNAVDVSRRPWSIAAFGDEEGLVVARDFICLWPRTGWSVNSLAAVLNGPVVNAFVAIQEPTTKLRLGTLKEAPLPRLGALDSDTLDRLVAELVGLFEEGRQLDRAHEVLLRIDSQVLRGYNLQPRLERKLLDFFRGRPRPVPFAFGDYFPPDFTPNFPLWMYISGDLARCTAAHLLRHAPEITDPVILAALEELG
jgi:hypothetical protein